MNLKVGSEGVKVMVSKMKNELLQSNIQLDKCKGIIGMIKGEIQKTIEDGDEEEFNETNNRFFTIG